MTPESFSPNIWTKDILRPRTREAIAKWLTSGPTSAEGEPIIAIHQRFTCSPAREYDPVNDPIQIISFEDVGFNEATIAPLVKHERGVGDMWSGEVTDARLSEYREPYFMLAHDETIMRLINSDLMLLSDAYRGYVSFYHFAHGSLMMSRQLAKNVSADDWEAGRWTGALVTAILPKQDSQHGRLALARTISQMNENLRDVFVATSDNFESLKPDPIPLLQ